MLADPFYVMPVLITYNYDSALYLKSLRKLLSLIWYKIQCQKSCTRNVVNVQRLVCIFKYKLSKIKIVQDQKAYRTKNIGGVLKNSKKLRLSTPFSEQKFIVTPVIQIMMIKF